MSTSAAVRALMERLSPTDRQDVEWAEAEALGYARGRMDANQDHHLPALLIEPMEFATCHAFHVAMHLYSVAQDGRSGVRRPIRESWEAWMTR